MHQNDQVIEIGTRLIKVIEKLFTALRSSLGITGKAVPVTVVKAHLRKGILVILLLRAVIRIVIASARESEHLERLSVVGRICYDKLICFINFFSKIAVVRIYCRVIVRIRVRRRKMPLLYHSGAHIRSFLYIPAHHKEGSLHVVFAKYIKYLRRNGIVRTVVKGEVHMLFLTRIRYPVKKVVVTSLRSGYRAHRRGARSGRRWACLHRYLRNDSAAAVCIRRIARAP